MSGRQLRRGRGRRGGRERRRIRREVVEEGREEERKKTEGRPPSGLIKSITSSLNLARDSPPPPRPPPAPHSRPFSLTPNSHNCSFFPLRRSSSYDDSRPSRPSSPISSRSAPPQSFIYAYFDPSTCRPTLVGNRFFLCPLPAHLLFLFIPSRCIVSSPRPRCAGLLSLSFSTSSLNNCEPVALLFLLPAPPHSTKGC